MSDLLQSLIPKLKINNIMLFEVYAFLCICIMHGLVNLGVRIIVEHYFLQNAS
jgi:hypothetical protein